MARFLRVRLILAILVTMAGVVMVSSSADATNLWGGYHWARTSNPFTLKLGDNVSSTWKQYLATTSSDWSQSTVLDTAVVPGSTTPKPCKAKGGQVQVCSAGYGNTGWLGVAQIWLSGTHITQGSVKVNDTYFATATYNKPGWRNMVMCQEVGHTLGLDHQDTSFNNPNLGTCMDYSSDPTAVCSTSLVGNICNPVQDNERPNQHDYDELGIIYSHLDSTTTLSAASSRGAPGGFDTPGEWGRRVAGSEQSHAVAVYERDLGRGQHILTFVIWAG